MVLHLSCEILPLAVQLCWISPGCSSWWIYLILKAEELLTMKDLK